MLLGAGWRPQRRVLATTILMVGAATQLKNAPSIGRDAKVFAACDPLEGKLEEIAAPRTCAAFRALLPFERQMIQARWSGEAAWVPLGALEMGLDLENATSHPSRGDILLYAGGASETELLFPSGSTSFASKVGPLAGNHFLTITSGFEQLGELGRLVVWQGAQTIRIESA